MVTLDTSAILASVDKKDNFHQTATAMLLNNKQSLMVPTGILSEVSYMIETKIGALNVVRFIQSVQKGELQLHPTEIDISRIEELLIRYSDLHLGFADAAVIACAEHNGGRVMTFDSDFEVVAKEKTITVMS